MVNKIKEVIKLLPNILSNKKNVIGWSLGKKIKNGVTSNEDVITVFVSKKENVSAEDAIPSKIYGINTDIVVQSDGVFHTIDPAYSCCKYCFSLYANNTAYGTNGCSGVINCNTENSNDYSEAEQAARQGCNCLPHRNLQLSSYGANNGKTVLNGGLSSAAMSPCTNCLTGGCCGGCTATIVARDLEDGKLVLITNQHCLGLGSNPYLKQGNISVPVSIGDLVKWNDLTPSTKTALSGGWGHPSSMDMNNPTLATNLGKFKKAVYTAPSNTTTNKVDCMAIELRLPDAYPTNYIIPEPGTMDLGDGPFPWATEQMLIDLWANTPADELYVFKSGRSTGSFTDDQAIPITNLYGTVTIQPIGSGPFLWEDVIIVRPPEAVGYATGGDSGSPVFVNYNGELYLLGIHFAGGGYGGPNGEYLFTNGGAPYYTRVTGYIVPIWTVADLLQVEYFDGHIVVESNDPTIYVNGKPYNRTVPTNNPITHIKD